MVLIHGIGDHSESWAQPFRDSLREELGGEAGNVMVSEAYWAPLSTPAELSHPSVAGGRLTIRESGLEDEAYRRTTLEFSRMLAAETARRSMSMPLARSTSCRPSGRGCRPARI